MKRVILLILGFVFTMGLQAQKQAKYEDYLPVMLSLPPSGAIALLKTYRDTEPENGSIHLQLATIYKQRYQEADPIKDYDYKIGNAKLAMNAYTLAESSITEKDVKKNQEYFFNFGKVNSKGRVETSFDSLQNNITRSKIELEAYIANGPNIYEKFTASFGHYDKAHKLFTEVVGKYDTFKDLYLLFDDKLDLKFEEIKQEYLKSIGFFEEYKAAIAAYPINYNQNLIIEEISVYRLDGLESQINFLEADISVWDYASWVDVTRAIIADEISSLRKSLIEEDLRLDNALETITAEYERNDFVELKVSKETLFNLRKYDLNTVIEPTFLYKEKKHDIKYHELLSQSLDTTANSSIDRKLFVYGQLINKLNKSDSSLTKITNKNDDNSVQKFNAFIESQYGSQQGISDYVIKERNEIGTSKSKYIDLIQDNLLSRFWSDTISKTTIYKKRKLPLNISPSPDSLALASFDFITTHKVTNFDSSAFVAGVFLHPKEKKIASFAAGITADGKVGWFKEYLVQVDSGTNDSDTRIAAMTSVPGGVAIMLNGVKQESRQKLNQLTMLNEKGESTFVKRLNIFQYPQSINFNDINNSLFITFMGFEYDSDILTENDMIGANFTLLGDLQWQHRFKFKGDIQNVINIGESYIVLGNYKEMRDLLGGVQRAGTEELSSRVFFMNIDKSGISEIRFMNGVANAQLLKTVKISNDCINLLGNKSLYDKNAKLNTEPGDWFHVILNRNLDILSSSL